jgi:hypothetical protein
METAGVEPTPPRCKRGALPIELHPQVRTGGVEPPQPWATGLQPAELTSAQRPQEKKGLALIKLPSNADLGRRCRPCQRRPLSARSTLKSNAGGRPSGFEPEPRGSRPRMLPLHHDHHAPMPASPASADHRRVDTKSNAGKSSWPAKRAGFPAESGDDRTRTGACSPDKRVLLPLSYVPR